MLHCPAKPVTTSPWLAVFWVPPALLRARNADTQSPTLCLYGRLLIDFTPAPGCVDRPQTQGQSWDSSVLTPLPSPGLRTVWQRVLLGTGLAPFPLPYENAIIIFSSFTTADSKSS